ncbi:MAG: cell division protein FtsW [Ruminococcaceae bacterium]|nr:cell division protein FtsW [Oscillospiraceae bacterium]
MKGKRTQKKVRQSSMLNGGHPLWTSRKKSLDPTFLLLLIIALAFGLIMVLSASAPTGRVEKNNSFHYFFNQLKYAAFGFFVMYLLSRIDYHIYKNLAGIAMIVGEILLLAVLIWGVEEGGATRWLETGFRWQPSELIKPAIALFFATLIDKRKTNFSRVRPLKKFIDEVWIYVVWVILTAALLLGEPHLSGTIVVVGIAATIIIVAGLPIWLVLSGGTVLGYLGYLLIKMFDPVRWARLVSFRDPFADAQGSGYQVVQSLYAIASGGLFGRGLGQSVQKYSYLPEPHNDFIFAIICEELGMIGGFLVMLLLAAIVIRGIKIASEAPDTYGTLVVVGIMAHVAIQSILNIAVATSTAPNTGISLPFFSYGGTALVVMLCEMGIVLNVSRQRQR